MRLGVLGPLGLASLGLTLLACAELRASDAEVEAAPPEEGETTIPEADPPRATDGGIDAAEPPTEPTDDVACGRDHWSLATKAKAECAARQVRVVSSELAIDVNAVAIARTAAGRVGIVWNTETMASAGEMRFASFTPTAPGFAAPTVMVRKGSDYEHVGHTAKIVASGTDTFHMLVHDVDDVDESGDIKVVKHTGAAPSFSTPEVVFAEVRRGAETAIAVDGTGTTVASARVSTGPNKARFAVARQIGAAAYAALPDLSTTLAPGSAPGIGEASLTYDAQGKLHLVYHHNDAIAGSWPRYHTFDGTGWSYRKTLDNNVPEGFAGYSPRLVVSGNKKIAAYFFRRSGQPAPATAELRIATWTGSDDTPQVSVIEQSITSTSDLSPRYRVAMAIDPFGLLHLAVVQPEGLDNGRLVYMRQVRAGGETKWLEDTIDPSVLAQNSDAAFVDLVVDERARPHIVYRSGIDGLVRYATRFDR